MPKYNDQIELTVDDMELIEKALRAQKHALSVKAHEIFQAGLPADAETDTALRQIDELLGRLHNQKVFYRPTGAAYVSG